MYGGIDQLVDTYKVNPNPLQARVQQAQQQAQQKMLQQGQQGQPSNEIPPDLEEAIALQKIAELHQGAQNQQAMQAGGAQPSVVAKLHQMLGTIRQQAQPQGEPVMAAHGGSIDQLMSNLGRHYAGGGIVAFQSAGSVKDPNVEEDKKPLRYYPLSEQGADWEARMQAERDAKIKAALEDEARRQALVSQIPTGDQQAPESTGPMPGEVERNINNAMAALPGASASKGFAGGIRNLMALVGTLGNREGNVTPATSEPAPSKKPSYLTPSAEALAQGVAPMPGPGGTKMGGRRSMDEILAAQAAASAAKPAGTGAPGITGATKITEPAEPTDPLEAAIRKNAMEALAKDPEEVRRRAIEANAKAIGLDALLKPAQERAAAREAMVKRIQESRQPLWIDALMSAGKPTRGGIAGVLGNMATGVNAVKQGYDVEDLKFIDELNKLNSEIDKARIEGRYKDVAAGETAVKDLINEKNHAEQSGTSLLNTKERAAATKQAAKDAAAGRAQSAAQHAQTQALALEERKRQFDENQLRLIRQNEVDRANKIETAIAKRAGMIDMQLQNPKLKPEEEAALQSRRNAIVKQVMAEYPSVKPAKPTESQFLAAARAANPGVSEAELKAYYKQNYGT